MKKEQRQLEGDTVNDKSVSSVIKNKSNKRKANKLAQMKIN